MRCFTGTKKLIQIPVGTFVRSGRVGGEFAEELWKKAVPQTPSAQARFCIDAFKLSTHHYL
jgi:hypothetical protein